MLALGAAACGCDRIAYEAKNNQVTQAVSNTYQSLNRIPDPQGQWQVCRDKEPGNIEGCMYRNGWKQNPAWDAANTRCIQGQQAANASVSETVERCSVIPGVPYYIATK